LCSRGQERFSSSGQQMQPVNRGEMENAMASTRILCIGEEGAAATRVLAKLHGLGYSVSAADTSDALGKAVQMRPDVICADLTGKPDARGMAAAERIARDLGIPLLFVVSEDSASLRQAAGPFGYVMENAGDRELEMAVEIARYRQMAEKQLRESEEKLKDVTSAFGEGIYILNGSGELTFMNPEAELLLGWSEAELMGKTIHGIIHAGNEEKANLPFEECTFYNSLRTGRKHHSDHEILRRRDGTTFSAVMASMPVMKDGKAVALITAFRDISEKEKTEDDVLNAKKHEAIGILTGGIAHDFNNLLTAIIGNISFAKMFVPPEDRTFERLEAAERAALQAKDLTYQLLVFAKGGEAVRKTVSPGRLIRDSAAFAVSGSNVRCDVSIPDGLSPVEVDTSQLRQVIFNLVTNAKEAMPGGGTITIRAEDVTLGHGELFPLKEGVYVKISIRDHGAGIPSEYLSRIFAPHFSTKEMGARKGTGFGLAVCYSIIRNHGGLITVESVVGKGTVFHVYLPASARPLSATVARKEMPLVGKGKVLIMDDEEIIRLVSGNMMSHIGFRVSLTRNGEEAIEAYKKAMENGEPFDIVILDLTVRGGMGGAETIAHLRKMDAGVRAIVSSGYPRDPVMCDFAKYGFRGALPKPYKIQELFEALQTAAPTRKEPPPASSGTERQEEKTSE
jgi:two-component system cell cycle sensor histidine kinase/response regulator CckA